MNKPSEKELKPCRACESRNVEFVRADGVYVQHCNDCGQDEPCSVPATTDAAMPATRLPASTPVQAVPRQAPMDICLMMGRAAMKLKLYGRLLKDPAAEKLADDIVAALALHRINVQALATVSVLA